MNKCLLIICILFSVTLFSGCGKSDKEKCEEKGDAWYWDESEKKCEQKPLEQRIAECKNAGGTWNESKLQCEGGDLEKGMPKTQQDCLAKGGTWNVAESKCENIPVSALTQEQCEAKQKEGFIWVNSQCEEKAIHFIRNQISSAVVVSSGEASVQLMGLECIKVKHSQFSDLKILSTTPNLVVCDNTSNRVAESPSCDITYSEEHYNAGVGGYLYIINPALGEDHRTRVVLKQGSARIHAFSDCVELK